MDNNFHFHTLVLVSKSWNGKRTLKVKAESFNEVYLKEEKKRLIVVADKLGTCPDYRVLGPRQLKALQEEVKVKGKAIFTEAPAKKPAQARATTRGKQTKDWREHVRHVIEREGFDYAFQYKTDFPEVKDKKFHALREAYCNAVKALKEYVGESDE